MWNVELANAIRFLSIDAIEMARSGHPGMPLGMADIAAVLWHEFLRHSPENPSWFNRDRFVLSNGHGSMLLYALLHLSGYALSLDEIKNFRQLHSKTPGHPEYKHTPGVETTTGPLGQGLANAVGMAIAEKHLASVFNRSNHVLVDHYTYVFVGDGCLMEGISHEVCSLAGTLKLGKLIVFYDDNGISIDGEVKNWFTDNTAMRFLAYGWHVIDNIDGHNATQIRLSIESARANLRPSILICKTKIGLGSPVENHAAAHGSPLGADGVAKTRDFFNWHYPAFEIPQTVLEMWSHRGQGKKEEAEWLKKCDDYRNKYPEEYVEFLRRINGDLPDDWPLLANGFLAECLTQEKDIATRQASQKCIEFWGRHCFELLGGSADLTCSNLTDFSGSKLITALDPSGNYIEYGVREFGMAAMMNGLALHGGVIPYGGTFLVFADYARNAIRLSAIMGVRVIYVLTHDSIGLGEDGPTHQPVEHAAMLRMTPNVDVWRPADLLETAIAWQEALERNHGPTCLLLSRQALPTLPHTELSQVDDIKKGAYVVANPKEQPSIILIATGSEVYLALKAMQHLESCGINARVVSMPCCERFLAQDAEYKESILPSHIKKRLAIEAASSSYWAQFVGDEGMVMGINSFGVSAKAADAFKFFGLTTEAIVTWAKENS